MTLMPNLHTVHIMRGPYEGMVVGYEQFQKAFAGLTFPSVRRVSFMGSAGAMFGYFPEAVEVFGSKMHNIHDLSLHFRKAETVGWEASYFTGAGGTYRRSPCISIACPWSYQGCSRGGKVSQSPQGRIFRQTV